jgi:hypothetical protein
MLTSILGSIMDALAADPLTTFILAIVFGVLGLIVSLVYWDKIISDTTCKRWPSASGTVVSSHIERRSNVSYNIRRRNTRYVPVIAYSYSVRDVPYQAERIGNGIYVGITRRAMDYWVKRFPKGAPISVYYNPAQPGDAVLVPVTNSNLVGFAVGIGISALSVFLVGVWLYHLL